MSQPDEQVQPDDIRAHLQTFYEVTASYQSRMLESSSGYNQVVVLAGYAGFFTIWSTVRNDIPHWLLACFWHAYGVFADHLCRLDGMQHDTFPKLHATLAQRDSKGTRRILSAGPGS